MAPEHIAGNLALLGFGIASLFFLWMAPKLNAQHEAKGLRRIGFSCLLFATLAASLSVLWSVRYTPISDLAGMLMACALGWMAVVEHIGFKQRLVSVLVAPVITLILLLQFFIAPGPRTEGIPLSGSTAIVAIHVVSAVVGQAFAIIACAIAMFYLWQQALLKRKRLQDLPPNLPAMDRTATLLTNQLWAGFLFLTIGLLTGAVYVRTESVAGDVVSPFKVVWAIFVWIWYLVTLSARNLAGASTKRVAQMALFGVVILAATYFGMGFWRGRLL